MSAMADMAPSPRPRRQKNFSLGSGVQRFEEWCAANGYDPKQVFVAGWLRMIGMEHEQRMPLFKKAQTWIMDDFAGKPEEVAADRRRSKSA